MKRVNGAVAITCSHDFLNESNSMEEVMWAIMATKQEAYETVRRPDMA